MSQRIHSLVATFLASLLVFAGGVEPGIRPSSASFPVAVAPTTNSKVWHESYMLDKSTGSHLLIGVSFDADHDGIIETSVGFDRVIKNGASILVVEIIKPALRVRTDAVAEWEGSPIVRERPKPEHPDNERIRASDGYKLIVNYLAR